MINPSASEPDNEQKDLSSGEALQQNGIPDTQSVTPENSDVQPVTSVQDFFAEFQMSLENYPDSTNEADSQPERTAHDSKDPSDQMPSITTVDSLSINSTELSNGEEPAVTDADSQEFDELFHTASNEEQADTQEDPGLRPRIPVKGRPQRKRGEGLLGIPNIFSTLIWAVVTLAVGITLGRMLWVCATDVLAFGRQDRQVTVTIYENDTIDDITEKLYNAKLIRYPGLFKFYAKFAVDEGEIKPGIWDLNTMYDYHALVKMMAPSSTREVVKVMIPEGYSCRQIFELLQDSKVCTSQDLAAYAANGELEEFWFLDGVERGDKYCLEGFLFPDTYEFYKNEKPEVILNKLLRNFDNRFPEELQDQIPRLNERLTVKMRSSGRSEDYIKKHQFTIRDVLTVASMIEKETATTQEAYNIASVIYNRLFSWGNTPAYLNIDATIVYALEGKTDLSEEDLQIDHPYNTYKNTGLTPGPIANPGLACIRAALDPADTSFYFYVLDPSSGVHHFSRTIEEHNAFRASIGD